VLSGSGILPLLNELPDVHSFLPIGHSMKQQGDAPGGHELVQISPSLMRDHLRPTLVCILMFVKPYSRDDIAMGWIQGFDPSGRHHPLLTTPYELIKTPITKLHLSCLPYVADDCLAARMNVNVLDADNLRASLATLAIERCQQLHEGA